MPDKRERAEPENRVRLVRPRAQGPAEGRLRARKVARVRGLPPAHLVREAEPDEHIGVARTSAVLALEPSDRPRRDASRRTGQHPVRKGRGRGRVAGDRGGGRSGGGRLGEDATDEPAEGERRRSGAAHEDCRHASHRRASTLPRATCAPCARSRGWARRRTGTLDRKAFSFASTPSPTTLFGERLHSPSAAARIGP